MYKLMLKVKIPPHSVKDGSILSHFNRLNRLSTKMFYISKLGIKHVDQPLLFYTFSSSLYHGFLDIFTMFLLDCA